jgi:hypothetical protein
MNGYQYRTVLTKNWKYLWLNIKSATLTIYQLPVKLSITLVQCDDDTDGISNFNLTERTIL